MNIKELFTKYGLPDENKLKRALNSIENKKIFLFTMSGKMAAGKDTIGDIISDKLEEIDKQEIVNVSFGYLIRNEVENIVSSYRESTNKISYAKEINATIEDLEKLSAIIKNHSTFDRTDEARTALQFWGTEVRRKQNTNYWINKMSKYIVDTVNIGYSINITDARFPNEVQLVKDMSGKIIRLEVPEDIRKQRIKNRDNIDVSTETLRHLSELALDDYVFERVFDGTESPQPLAEKCYGYITTFSPERG